MRPAIPACGLLTQNPYICTPFLREYNGGIWFSRDLGSGRKQNVYTTNGELILARAFRPAAGKITREQISSYHFGELAQLARALAWHARGRRFDSDILHALKSFTAMWGFFFEYKDLT
jgi:hypothetical protein